jgi:hypothetical protein
MRLTYSILVFLLSLGFSLAVPSAPLDAPGPFAPERLCEFNQSSWCIAQGAWKVSRQFDQGYPNGAIWTLVGRENPGSELVVFAPHGCKDGFADEASLKGYKSNYNWSERVWLKMSVRAKADGSCDLDVLVPMSATSLEDWAFSDGRLLVWICYDKGCGKGTTVADVTDRLRSTFKRNAQSTKGDGLSQPRFLGQSN